jgi:hypothetical protein
MAHLYRSSCPTLLVCRRDLCARPQHKKTKKHPLAAPACFLLALRQGPYEAEILVGLRYYGTFFAVWATCVMLMRRRRTCTKIKGYQLSTASAHVYQHQSLSTINGVGARVPTSKSINYQRRRRTCTNIKVYQLSTASAHV